MSVEKLQMHSPNIVDNNIKKIGDLFPNSITETKDEYGNIKKVVDFDILKQELSDSIISEKDERYQFTWPEKRKSILLANSPISETLRPCIEESLGKDGTPGKFDSENLYIEGDNLDVLKLLQHTYMNQIKMIYIDPPYNTGNDFVYEDDYSENSNEYLNNSGQFDNEGNKLVQNLESNGRFHTDWLNMIYPRLKIARDLLTDDGAICIHIDDNEFDNLTKICNEIFGDSNFINIITVKTKIGGVSGSSEGKSLKDATEFILFYAKDKSKLELTPTYIKQKLSDRIASYKVEGKSWKFTSVITNLSGKEIVKEDKEKNIIYYGYKNVETMSIAAFAKSKGLTEEQVYNQYADKIFRTTNAQSSVRATVMKETKSFDYPVYGCEYIPIKGKNAGNRIEILYKGPQKAMVMFLSDYLESINGEYYYLDRISTLWDDIQYNNLTKEGNIAFPNGKKPIKLLSRLIHLICDKDSIVLDFFSGSASTAHAVMAMNAEDHGQRRFIMVQLPEKCKEKSEAKKAGYQNICEIGKERIRRVVNALKQKESLLENLDCGFRVFKLDSTNMKDIYYTPEKLLQIDLDGTIDNIKADRTHEDLLIQVMLELGIPLSSPIRKSNISGKTVFNVDSDNNFLLACFDDNITNELITEIAKLQPYYFVMRDNSMQNDSVASNFEQIFKTYSPTTIRRVL